MQSLYAFLFTVAFSALTLLPSQTVIAQTANAALSQANMLPVDVSLPIQQQGVNVLSSIKSMRERAKLVDEMLNDKLSNTLPELMRREGIDMWILISREYNEDPVLKTMLPSTWLSARRRTILVIHDPGEGEALARYSVSRYQVDTLFQKAWDKESQPDQWQR